MNTLIVLAERCVHQRVAKADCDSCVRACPQSAWKTEASGLSFDSAVCDGCGLCVAACPCEALALPQGVPLLRTTPDGNELLIACERAAPGAVASAQERTACQSGSTGQISQGPDSATARLAGMHDPTPPAGTIPCLQALTPHGVLRWAGDHAASRIRYASGDCQQCSRGRGPAWQQRYALATASLHAHGRPVPALQALSFQAWKQAVAPQAAPEMARRGLLRTLLRAPRTAEAAPPLAPMTSARASLLQLLRDLGAARALWAVNLNPDRCTWCMACVQLCARGALQFAAATGRFTLDMQRCTGCGVCVSGCAQQALRNSAPPGPAHDAITHIALQRLRCTQCGVDFQRLPRGPAHAGSSLRPATTGQSPLCPACKQGRPAQHDRWVQAGEGA